MVVCRRNTSTRHGPTIKEFFMFGFQYGVLVLERLEGAYDVFCNRCNDAIGSMRLGTIRDAVFNTLGRGGVLCPPCRSCTCDGCGAMIVDGTLQSTGDHGETLKLCKECLLVYNDKPLVDGAVTAVQGGPTLSLCRRCGEVFEDDTSGDVFYDSSGKRLVRSCELCQSYEDGLDRWCGDNEYN